MSRDLYDAFKPKDRGMFGENECGNDSDSPTKAARSNLVDLKLPYRNETERAVGVTDPARENSQEIIWLPKSQIEFQKLSPFFVEVTLPRWLAKEKGLI